jgi:hypothetical protein
VNGGGGGGHSPAYSRVFLALGTVVVAVWVFQLLRLLLHVGGAHGGVIVAGSCILGVGVVLVLVSVQRRRSARRQGSGTSGRMS